jgi:hypothetical protein
MNQDVRVYARPSHYSDPIEKEVFDKELSNSKSVKSPESPWNNPDILSWRNWSDDISSAIEKQGY